MNTKEEYAKRFQQVWKNFDKMNHVLFPNDKFIREFRNSIIDALNKAYEEGFEDGANEETIVKKYENINGIDIGRTYCGQWDEKCREECLLVNQVVNGRVTGYNKTENKNFDYSIEDFKYLMSIK